MAQLKNLNESYHNVIWSMCRKTTCASSTTVKLAENLAVVQFNLGKSVGLCNILEPMCIAAFAHLYQLG